MTTSSEKFTPYNMSSKQVTAQDIYEDVFFKELLPDEKRKLDNMCDKIKEQAVQDYLNLSHGRVRNPFGNGKSELLRFESIISKEKLGSVLDALLSQARHEAIAECESNNLKKIQEARREGRLEGLKEMDEAWIKEEGNFEPYSKEIRNLRLEYSGK